MDQSEVVDAGIGASGDDAEGEARSQAPGRSTIGFPYDDLGAAMGLARLIFEKYGGHATMDQLAAEYQQKPTSGAFRIKVTATRIFGLVTVSRSGIDLTDMGAAILDSSTEAETKVRAFLHVPLYAALYERFKGKTLPPGNTGLEAVVRDLGVLPKQASVARWRFQRSAEVAGFFSYGKDRLVMPALSPGAQQQREDGAKPDEGGRDDGGLGMKPAIIVEFFKKLPNEGQEFSPEGLEVWMAAFKATLPLAYKPRGDVITTSVMNGNDEAAEHT